jgi:8-oxo-dGTP pyrophosphatase MutT (NUDIX family)
MESFAAGIVPYVYFEGKTYFLLGLERSNNKWSGFIGGSEPGEHPKQTALREFHEETAKIFESKQRFLDTQLQFTDPMIQHSTTGKTVYIWFLEFPPKTFSMNFAQFHRNQTSLPEAYREKLELRWFNVHDIKTSKNVLYKLKHLLFGMLSQ